MKSKCCSAKMSTVSGSEGTNYWACDKCGDACDPRPSKERVWEFECPVCGEFHTLWETIKRCKAKRKGYKKEEIL